MEREYIKTIDINGDPFGDVVEVTYDEETERFFDSAGNSYDPWDVVMTDTNGNMLDERISLAPKGCFFAALNDAGIVGMEAIFENTSDFSKVFDVLEKMFMANGLIHEREDEFVRDENGKTPKEVFSIVMNGYLSDYVKNDAQVEVAWDLFTHYMKLHGNVASEK